MSNQSFESLLNQLSDFKEQLMDILVHNKSGVNLRHKLLREQMYAFPNPTIQERATINQKIRLNIREFIKQYMSPKIDAILGKNDAYIFVETMSQLLNNFQRFVFAHDFIVDKYGQFFETFYKMGNARNYQTSGQIVPIPIIAVNELKQYFNNSGKKGEPNNIYKTFPKHFSTFVANERSGINVPRQMLKQSVAAIQSSYFDFEATITFDINRKPSIVKNPAGTPHIGRKATDAKYFQENLLKNLLADCQTFYTKLVRQQTPKLSPVDQLDLISRILVQQQSRSTFYIHTPQNQKKYLQTVDRILIGLQLQTRISKEDGLIKFFREYQPDKEDFKTQLTKFWKIYSRIMFDSLVPIVRIYNQYLDEEAIVAQSKIDKPAQFITEMLRINTKNITIVSFFGVNFELENQRNQKIRGMLSNEIVKDSRYKGKYTMGATNLALFVNNKFKQIYSKGQNDSKQTLSGLVLLFKILQDKVHFTKQHQKHIANRLMQDVDFSKVNQFTNIISLQKGFIDQMQKQMGVSEVKQLLQNIKDIEKSFDHTIKLKQNLSKNPKASTNSNILNQLIVKNNTFWPQKNTYQVEPPVILLKLANQVEAYFNKTANIQFQYNNGMSIFRGQFKSKVPKQLFFLKNMYLIILLILDEAPNKMLFYNDIRRKIKSYGMRKQRGNLQLNRNIIEMLHNGLLLSSTRILSKDDPKCIQLVQNDKFQLNRQFDLEQQLKRNKVPAKLIKKVPTIKTINITMLPDWIKKMFAQKEQEIGLGKIEEQKQRRFRVKQISVKGLKHAHNQNLQCTFDQLYKAYDKPQHRQYRVGQKYLKQIIEQLINDEYCERVQGQRNMFKYKA